MWTDLEVCLHVPFLSLCPLLPLLKFIIVQMVAVWIWTEKVMYPFSLHYSDDNKKNTFNNGANNGHGLKKLCVNRPLRFCTKDLELPWEFRVFDALYKPFSPRCPELQIIVRTFLSARTDYRSGADVSWRTLTTELCQGLCHSFKVTFFAK